MKIAGAVALVTGASRGLGWAYANALVEHGARTVCAGARDPSRLTDPALTPIRLDITDEQDVAAAAELCSGVTLLINNAGIATGTALLGAPSMEFARAEMETNYFGTLRMCRAFGPVLARNGGGALVNMLSVVSFFNWPSGGSQCASKAAEWSLTNGVRMELRSQGTLVVGVHASFIDTDLTAELPVPKLAPSDVANQTLDAVEEGREEVLADERTRNIKAALPRDLDLIYPDVEKQWRAAFGSQ